MSCGRSTHCSGRAKAVVANITRIDPALAIATKIEHRCRRRLRAMLIDNLLLDFGRWGLDRWSQPSYWCDMSGKRLTWAEAREIADP